MADGSSQYHVEGAASITDLNARLAQYVPLGSKEERQKLLEQYTSSLSDGDRQAVRLLVQAAQLMDQLYLTQEWEGNLKLKSDLEAKAKQGDGTLLRYFNINQGPWDKLHENRPFIDGVVERPPGGNYYPRDMTKDEFEAWVATLSPADQEHARGYYHVVRRPAAGKGLALVPYSEEYRAYLEPAATLLEEAAALVSDQSLAHFLKLRAQAFHSNEYVESDMAWMDVAKTSPLEIVIGPYEVYADALCGYKASFEAFVCVQDQDSSRKLEQFSQCMQELEDNLPISDAHKNKLGASQPIVAVNLIYVGGDRAGPQTAAFNLPNNAVVVKAKGSKMVILKNVQEKKFASILMPICNALIAPEQRHLVKFDSFFTHILAHEMSHGLGPHTIPGAGGSTSSVSKELQEYHSALEEAKADVAGLWTLQYLINKGQVSKDMEQSMYVTYLASQFRSLRFGLEEAHGRGHALQMNTFIDLGAYSYDQESGHWSVNFDRIQAGVTQLTRDIMEIQAAGDKAAAKAIMDRLARLTPHVEASLKRLGTLSIPVDIESMRLYDD